VRLVASSPEPAPARAAAAAVADGVRGATGERTEVLGPAPLFRLRGRERWQVVLKTAERARAVTATGRAVEAAARARAHRAVAFSVDVDPQ
jgi:primosomal protein N' (replication factor Y)